MSVVFDEVIANVETPVDRTPTDSPPATAEAGPNKKHEIIDAVEAQQRRARRLQAD